MINRKMIIMLILSILLMSVGCNQTTNAEVASIVTVDINPSIKLSLDDQDQVISYKALNKDAETLLLNQILGLPVEDAVEIIVNLATDAGFITEDGLTDNYVLISTINMQKKDRTDNLKAKLEDKIESSDDLHGVNVAIIKATKVEMLEAENKKVPVGLYVINGQISVDGAMVSVKEFFSNKENKDAFNKKGTVIAMQEEKKFEQFMKSLDRAEQKGEDVSAYRNALENGGDLNQVIESFKKNNDKNNERGNSNNENKANGKGNK